MKHIAVVTGASSGIGREFVRLLDTGKWGKLDEIWLIARRGDRLKKIAKHSRIRMRIFEMDLGEPDQYKEYVKALDAENPWVRYLVNAAGFGRFSTFTASDIDEQAGMVDVNARAVVEMSYYTLPYMAGGSNLINISSGIIFAPQPHAAVYTASKSFVYEFSRMLHWDLKDVGINVVVACPKASKTEFFKGAGDKRTIRVMKLMGKEKPKKIARAALKHANAGKDVSISSWAIKGLRLKRKVMPLNLLMRAEKILRFY